MMLAVTLLGAVGNFAEHLIHPLVANIATDVGNFLDALWNKLLTALDEALYNTLVTTNLRPDLFNTMTGSGRLISAGSGAFTGGQQAETIFAGAAIPGVTLAAVAGGIRLLKGNFEAKKSVTALAVGEVLPRVGVVAILLAPLSLNPYTSVALGFLDWVISFTGVVGGSIFSAFAHNLSQIAPVPADASGAAAAASFTANCPAVTTPGGDLCTAVGNYFATLTVGHGLLFTIFLVILIVFIFYFMILLIMRAVILTFVVAMAPLALAMMVYSFHNRLTDFWADLLIGSLMLPVIMGLGMAISITLCLTVAGLAAGTVATGALPTFSVVMSAIIFGAGLWFTGKMVSTLTWKHVQSHSLGHALEYVGAANVISSIRQAPQNALRKRMAKNEAAKTGSGTTDSSGTENGEAAASSTGGVRGAIQTRLGARTANSSSRAAQVGNAMAEKSAILGGAALLGAGVFATLQHGKGSRFDPEGTTRNRMQRPGTFENDMMKDWAKSRGGDFSDYDPMTGQKFFNNERATDAYLADGANKEPHAFMVDQAARHHTPDLESGGYQVDWSNIGTQTRGISIQRGANLSGAEGFTSGARPAPGPSKRTLPTLPSDGGEFKTFESAKERAAATREGSE